MNPQQATTLLFFSLSLSLSLFRSDKEMDLKFKWLDFATAKPSVVPMVKQGTVDEPLGVVLLELHQGEFGTTKFHSGNLKMNSLSLKLAYP